MAGVAAVLAAQRVGAIPGIVANYVAHTWMAVIALTWYVRLGRRFPIGRLDNTLRPWFVVALILIAVNLGETIASPPGASLHVPALPTLAAELVFLALVVGPSEELLFRGLIQTGLNGSIRAKACVFGWPVGLGTVIGAVLFGLFHLVNVVYQPLLATLQQAVTAVIIGLVFGVLYDRTQNLVGASLAHSLADFSGTAIPLLAYLLIKAT